MLSKLKPYVERFPTIAACYRGLRGALAFHLARPRATPFGFKLMGNPLMESGVFEPEETALIRELLDGTDVFVDVGANVGFYTCLARSAGKRAIAIEPLRQNLDYLLANLEANDWRDVEIYPVGLAHCPGLATLHGGGTAASLVRGWANAPASLLRTIPLSTLDILVGDRFEDSRLLIKIDVEGAECNVLKGAAAVLQRDPAPIWMVEICLSQHHPDGVNPGFRDTFTTMWQYGYRSWTADGQRRAVEAADVERWVKQRRCDFGRENYLFARD